MSKVVRIIAGAALIAVGAVTGNFQLILAGVSLAGGALFQPSVNGKRSAAAQQLQLGEQPRQAIFGRAAVGGSLVDAFNYGGKYGTDWEVLVIALADHRCDALEGFFVDDTYVAFSGDGMVPGYNNQLQVFWRDGRWDQEVPALLTANGPGWTADDRGRGVAWVAVAYKADASDAKDPVWPSGRPRFRWVVRGLRAYQARKDSTVGGSGAHRWNDPATWEWTENPIDIRHTWQRGIYAGDRVNEPGMLLIGRGLSAIEAPPANVFPRANLCDELVDGQPRYRIGGIVASTEPFIDVESDFAAAVAGTISQPQGAVEVDPGEAKAPVAHFTDGDLLVGSKVMWNRAILGQQDDGWINTVAVRFVDPDQRWNIRSAPVRRELADVIADGAPRESQPQLDMVTNQPQAQRIAEIIRRFGRLWGRAQVTLPPRFAFIEEGDWVTWQSDRRFGGATRTFRVEAWGSNKAWHHQLTLRQISASVYSDTAPLDDGVIASTQGPPPVVGVPAAGAWVLSATQIAAGGVRVPALLVTGQRDDPAAQNVIIEYVQQTAAPGVDTVWSFAVNARGDLTRAEIPVPGGGTYWLAVSYVVQGVLGDRRVLGPVTLADFTYPDGTPFSSLQPAVSGATRNEDGGGNMIADAATLALATYTAGANATIAGGGPAAQLAGADFGTVFFGDFFPVRGGERLYFSFVGWTDIANGNSVRGGYTWRDGGGAETSVDLPDTALAGTAAVGLANQVQRTQAVNIPANAVSLRFYVVRPSFSAGGSFFIRRPYVGRSEPGATVGAPAGTSVAGVEASALTAQAAQAQTNAAAAVLAIATITNDGILSIDEKPEIRKQRQAILDEYPRIRASALSANLSVATFDTQYSDLIAYLAVVDLDGATNTTIIRNVFNTRFTNYYDARQALLDQIASRGIGSYAAKQNLLFNGRFRLGLNGWENVTGVWRFIREAAGQFVEQPLGTGGTFVLRSTMPINTGPGGQMVISLQAFALAGSATEYTFADIEWRNGGNDTLLGYSSAISGNAAIIAANAAPGSPIYASQPVVAPNPTDGSGFVRAFVRIVSIGTLAYAQGGHPALGVKVETGTVPSAISDEATDGAVLDRTSGRIRDPQAYNTQAILGPRNVTNLAPTYTVGGSNVTVNLPAHQRQIAGRNGPVVLNYGAVSGVVAFSSYWTAYIDDPELTGFTSPAATFTSNPADLLFPGRYQIAAGLAPASGGGGGAFGGGGGGGGGYNPNLPPGTEIP